MLCPRCQKEMKEVIYEGVLIDNCPFCGGNWLDKDEIILINKIREKVFSEEEKKKVRGINENVTIELKPSKEKLYCPRCKEPLQQLNYAYTTGIIVDKCLNCGGLWLDKEELEHIQMVIEEWEKKAPSLYEKTFPLMMEKIKAAEKKIEQAKEEIKKREIENKEKKSFFSLSLVKALIYKIF